MISLPWPLERVGRRAYGKVHRHGAKSWHTPMVRIGRDWASAAIAERWPTWQSSLEPAACTPDMARWLQASIAQTANALAAWTDRIAAGHDAPAPTVQDIGWWVP